MLAEKIAQAEAWSQDGSPVLTNRRESIDLDVLSDRCSTSTSSPPTSLGRTSLTAQDRIDAAADTVGMFLETKAERTGESSGESTPFDSSKPPAIDVSSYFLRIRKYSDASPEAIVCALALIRQVCAKKGWDVDACNVHRLLLAAVMVNSKYHDDEPDDNARWARIGGLRLSELNVLEIQFLNACNFDLRVPLQLFLTTVSDLTTFTFNPSPSTASPASTRPIRRGIRRHTSSQSHGSYARTKSVDGARKRGMLSFFVSTPPVHLDGLKRPASSTDLRGQWPSDASPASSSRLSPAMSAAQAAAASRVVPPSRRRRSTSLTSLLRLPRSGGY
jgi:hypothetical protein